MNRLNIILLVFLGGCQLASGADHYPFPGAPKGEARFFDECIEAQRECRWLRLTQSEGDRGFSSFDSYIFPATADIAELRLRSPCESSKKLRAEVSSASFKEIHVYESTKIDDPTFAVCELRVPSFKGTAGASGFNFIRIENAVLNSDGINQVFEFPANARNKVVLQSAADSALFLETNFTNGDSEFGYHKLTSGNASILEFESLPGEGKVIGISSKANWDGLSQLFKEKSAEPSRVSLSRTDLDEALDDYQNLNLKYNIDNENFGFTPQLEYSRVIAKGAGDCKDLTVVLMRKLAERGVRSQPVLLGIRNGRPVPPVLRNLPDRKWANHVIVYLPDFNIYVDATQPSGKYVIDHDYPWYRAIGVNLDTQKMVIVGS